MEFSSIKQAVANKFTSLENAPLFVSNATKDELWDTYLNSFPEGTNPIYLERTEHDCNCCKQYIRAVGNVLAIVDGELVSPWDIEIGGFYQVVADAMSALVKSKGIDTIFLHSERSVGTDKNLQFNDPSIEWSHFHQVLPRNVVTQDVGARKGKARDHYNTLSRSMTEISRESVQLVQELIAQDSLYRGNEHSRTLSTLAVCQREYDAAENKEFYCWETSSALGHVSAFRGTAIGSLLCDLSDGRQLDSAVKSFEDKMSGTNYKRPKALITQGMIKKAEDTIVTLGCTESLPRRLAVTEDITINNVLYADRSTQKEMGVLGILNSSAKVTLPKLDKVEEVSIERFINEILPQSTSIELAMANNQVSNLMTLVAPLNPSANSILKWNNNFSWSYNGEVADSVKELVRVAGGKVDGDFRCSLNWFNSDDLDLHLRLPSGHTIYHGQTYCNGGHLDIDMNAGGKSSATCPVENITWANRGEMPEGNYKVIVEQYARRNNNEKSFGFGIEIEFDGVVYNFNYNQGQTNGERISVVKFNYTKANGLVIKDSIGESTSSVDHWGVTTQQFRKVNMIMNSPNHWDGEETGNKHWFFILDKCINPDPVRGFYNEFLRPDLNEHRKVFEVLGSKMKPEHSDNQLSGLGFSSTQRNEVLCKVSGAFNRIIKIKF